MAKDAPVYVVWATPQVGSDSPNIGAPKVGDGRSGKAGHDDARHSGERVILPEVRKADDGVLILADGFSCRTQIEQGTGRRVLHLAEALKMALEPVRHGARAAHPEHAIAARRNAAVARSIRRARVTTLAGLLAIVGIGALLVARKRN